MSDTQAVQNLVHHLAELLDSGDFAGIGRLFSQATYRTLTPSGVRVATGTGEVQAWLERSVRRYGDGTPGTRHLITNPIVEVDRAVGRATCRSCFTLLRSGHARLDVVLTGRYEDAFVRDGDGWRFADRFTLIDLVGDIVAGGQAEPFS